MARLISGIVIVFALFFLQAALAHSKKQAPSDVPNGPKIEPNADGTVLVLDQQDFLDAEDTYIELNHRERNHHNDQYLVVSHNRSRAAIQFRHTYQKIHDSINHPGSMLVSGPNITKATLLLSIIDVECWVDKQIAIHRLPTFNEKKANWDCSDYDSDMCCSQWRMNSLLPQVEASYDAEASDVRNIKKGQTGRLSFDVTEDYIEYFENFDEPTIGWLLKKVVESVSTPGLALFYPSGAPLVQGKVVEPELIVEYQYLLAGPPTIVEKEPCPDDEWNWDEKVDPVKDLAESPAL